MEPSLKKLNIDHNTDGLIPTMLDDVSGFKIHQKALDDLLIDDSSRFKVHLRINFYLRRHSKSKKFKLIK